MKFPNSHKKIAKVEDKSLAKIDLPPLPKIVYSQSTPEIAIKPLPPAPVVSKPFIWNTGKSPYQPSSFIHQALLNPLSGQSTLQTRPEAFGPYKGLYTNGEEWSTFKGLFSN